MKRLILCLVLGAASATGAGAQEYTWKETRFHRVHLRNGNFVDGQLLRVTDVEILLEMNEGQIAFRRNMVDRVELMKIRTLGEKPKLDPPLIKPGPTTKATPKPTNLEGEPISDKSTKALYSPEPETPEGADLKSRTAQLLNRLRYSTPDQRDGLIEEFTRLPDQPAPYLADLLDTLSPEAASYVGMALIRMKDPDALPALARQLESGKPHVRSQAALIIGTTGNVDYAPRLRRLLADPSQAVRVAVIDALKQLGDYDSLESIIDLIMDSDAEIRVSATRAALELGLKYDSKPRVANGIKRALDGIVDPNRAEEVADLLRALGSTGLQEFSSKVASYLNDVEPDVRAAAASSLTTLAAPSSLDAILERMTVEQSPTVLVQLAAAARALKSQRAIDPLIEMLKSPDSRVQQSALITLRALTRQSFGVDPEGWTGWWEQARPGR